MKKLVKLMMIITAITFFCDIAFAQVTCDFDKTVNFNKYKTYSFAGWQENSDQVLNDLDKDRILNSFKAEFEKRTMSLVNENADAIVTLYIVIENKTSTTAYTAYNSNMGMSYGVNWAWSNGSATTTYTENDYLVGTLVVDVYDAVTKKLIWQGVSQSTIKENAAKREKTIPKKVSKLMKKFPLKVSK